MGKFSFKSSGLKIEEKQLQQTAVASRGVFGIKTPIQLGDNEVYNVHENLANQIRDNFRNMLLTNYGERLGRQNFGADLRKLAIEYYSIGEDEFTNRAISNIKSSVSKFMPFIELDAFELSIEEDHHANVQKANLKISYDVSSVNVFSQAVNFSFYLGAAAHGNSTNVINSIVPQTVVTSSFFDDGAPPPEPPEPSVPLYPDPHWYWTFDNAYTTGTITTDSIQGTTGVLTADVVTGATGKLGEAYTFDGDAPIDAVDFPGNLFDFTGSFAVAMWVQPNDSINGLFRLIGNREQITIGSQTGWGLNVDSKAFSFFIEYDTEVVECPAVTQTTSDPSMARWLIEGSGFGFSSTIKNWYHLGCSFDSTTGDMKAYWNGIVTHTASFTASIGADLTSGRDSRIGAVPFDDVQRWDGDIDDVMVWEGTIPTDDEYMNHYAEKVGVEALPRPTNYWTFDNANLTGSTVTDIAGSSPGTLTSSATFETGVEGAVGEAVKFELSSNELMTMVGQPFDFTGSFSISIWFYPDGSTVSNQRLMQNRGTGAAGTQDGWFLRLAGGRSIEFWLESGGVSNTTSQTDDIGAHNGPTLNQWHHVACTWDTTTGTKRVYTNGTLTHINTTAGLIGADFTSGRLSSIGASIVGSTVSQEFDGRIDEAACWDGTVLTEGQVAALWLSGSTGQRLWQAD